MSGAGPALVLERRQLAALEAAAQAAYPEECCGLVVGRPTGGAAWRATRLVPAANLAADRRRSFELDPAAHFAVLRGLREAAPGGEQLLGHYHSHPDAAAAPSERDRAQAHDPDMIWLIIAVAQGRAAGATAWQATLSDDGGTCFHSIVLTVVEDGAEDAENPC